MKITGKKVTLFNRDIVVINGPWRFVRKTWLQRWPCVCPLSRSPMTLLPRL